jgi:small subunit ribosomal protein S2
VATATGQHFVVNRWLGGTLTNMNTIRKSVKRLKEIETMEADGTLASMHKKEAAALNREMAKLRRTVTGITGMAELPGALVVVDIQREAIAVKEANRTAIPVVAIVDTNCDPDAIDYPIPGNDDALRAIRLVCTALADSVRKGAAEYSRLAAEQAQRAAAAEAERAAAEKERAEKQKSEEPKVAEAKKPAPATPRRAAARKPKAAAAPAAPAGPPDKPAEPAPAAKTDGAGPTETQQPKGEVS